MRVFIIAVILIVAFVLQSTILQYFEVWMIKPNLIVMITVYFALTRGSVEGGIVGLSGGILADILVGRVFGLYALIGMYTGVLAGNFNKRFFKENYLVALLFTFLFSFLYEFAFYILNYFIWGETRILYALQYIIIPEALYNCVIAIPVYIFVIKINRWLEKKEKVSRKY
ncbi:rod shape-determining protein MreD [Petroclostridium sp. X23]|uniref:rod shape-determining protein MreD n=1 Tax=Petroclostridium sp. X23 TaxID=3045146 RepID=UPI0024AD71AC|nr:rod shape-determining protein MreD [Petroclostridium sp. X23]WHH61052.1 rod shape-determining protein MreD [Petroclostridium sp. X23]